MADPLIATINLYQASMNTEQSFRLKVKELFSLLAKTFPCGKELKEEIRHSLWNAIFIHAENTRNKDDCDSGTGRYSSTKKHSSGHLDSG